MTPQQKEMRDLIVDVYGEKAGKDYENSLDTIDYSKAGR